MAHILYPRPVRSAARGGRAATSRRAAADAARPFRATGWAWRSGWSIRDNPLTARVTVNRFWQEVFGTGLVKTAEDFGIQGEPPSHPELLDWLAVEFRESGWDVKKFFKLMVTSADLPAVGARDAGEAGEGSREPAARRAARASAWTPRWCATTRWPPAACSSPKIGGPSVKPYQPDGVWEAVAMIGSNTRVYKQDTGDKLYRRSLYTFWKRSAPPASMDIFNAPTRETCTVRRERTNTPLQALVTMNDAQFVEAARHLAEQRDAERGGLRCAGSTSSRSRLLARPLRRRRERRSSQGATSDFLDSLRRQPEDAKKLHRRQGESKPDADMLPAAGTGRLDDGRQPGDESGRGT